jgi:hypothetical protein
MADGSEDLRRLAVDLAAAPERARGQIQQVVAKGALNIKTDWRGRVSALHRLRHLQFAVNYDMVYGTDSIGADVGYDKARVQAPLGNIEEFGTASTPGHLDGQHALSAEEPRFIAALEDVAERSVLP